jgi:hypothetical protein
MSCWNTNNNNYIYICNNKKKAKYVVSTENIFRMYVNQINLNLLIAK